MQQVVVLTKAFCKWREIVKEMSLTYDGNTSDSALHQQSIIQELLSKFSLGGSSVQNADSMMTSEL